MSETYKAELTQGEDPDGKETYGVIIWLNTKSETKAKKVWGEIVDKLNEGVK